MIQKYCAPHPLSTYFVGTILLGMTFLEGVGQI